MTNLLRPGPPYVEEVPRPAPPPPAPAPLNQSNASVAMPRGNLREVRQEFDERTGVVRIEAVMDDGQIWTAWNTNYIAINMINASTGNVYNSTTASTISTAIWTAWNHSYSVTGGATTVTYTEAAWGRWNERHEEIGALRTAMPNEYARYARRQLSEDELKRELEREKRYREEAEKRAREAEEAKARAERLLLGCLSERQKEDLKNKNCFYIEVPLADGKVERYRIDRGSHGNVKQVDEKGSIIRSFCVQPEGVPAADAMLAQKLFIEADEETRAKFWETANITDLMPAKKIPHHIPRNQRRQYALQHGLLH